MAALIRQYLCCCLPHSHSRSPPDHSLQDERAPLLNPDILPSAPSRPTQRTTEQEQAERDQLRRILHLAEQRLLSVESLAPFRAVEPTPVATTTSSDSNKKKRSSRSNRRKSRHDQPAPRSLSESSSSTLTLTAASPRRSRRHAVQEQEEDDEEEEEDSPSRRHRRDGSHSRSRVHPAAGDEGAGPLAPIRVVHLDRTTWTEIDTPGLSRKGGSEVRVRPGSSHSMKTLPGSRQGKSPVAAGMSGLSITTTNSDHDDDDDDDDDTATADDDFQDAQEGEGEGGRRSSTRFGTVESYRTAREQGDDEDEDWSTTGRSRDGRRRHARDLWSQASGKGTDEELACAIEQLERDIDSWTLPPHGPFTADLGEGGGGGGSSE